MTVLRALDPLDVKVRAFKKKPPRGFDHVIDISVDGHRARYAVEYKARAPFPSELRDFLARRPPPREMFPLLVAPHVSRSLGEQLRSAGWSWLDEEGNVAISGPGIRLVRQVTTRRKATRRPSRFPQGPAALRVIRFLISHGGAPLHATRLATVADVSQPRASQILTTLRALELVDRRPSGWEARREVLLDAFLESYRGPGGHENYYFSLESPMYVAQWLTQVNRHGLYVSADVGPDVISPWRRPTHLVAYAKRPVKVPANRLIVPAKGAIDANVFLRIPDDASVFCPMKHEATVEGSVLRLAEHTQMLWDLAWLGGEDRDEAAIHLRKWLLSSR